MQFADFVCGVAGFQPDFVFFLLPDFERCLGVIDEGDDDLSVFGVFGFGVSGKLRIVLSVVFGFSFVVCA